jgi:hypothetical protein
MYNPWGNAATQPSPRVQDWRLPSVGPAARPAPGYNVGPYDDNPAKPWNGAYVPTYAPLKTEREEALERQLARAEEHAFVLEMTLRRLEQELAASRRRLYQWRINIRNSMIAFLCVFIVVWATVSILVRYPVLPWDMPSVIKSLLGSLGH